MDEQTRPQTPEKPKKEKKGKKRTRRIILVIVLAGSLWVMHNMNVNMMPVHNMDMGGETVGLSPEAPAMQGMDHSAHTGN